MSVSSTASQADQVSNRSAACRRKFASLGRHLLLTALLVLGFGSVATPARAADGCLILLCFAAPSWRSIEQCAVAVESVLNDIAHGHPFPSCDTAGTDNQANLKWSDPPSYCPPQYTTAIALESGTTYQCKYDGAVEVNVAGQLWTRTWWSESGDSVTEFSPAAKASLGTWDTRFDDDYAAWSTGPLPACDHC